MAKFEVHIISLEDDEIIHTMKADSERQAERIQRGAEINLNHDLFYTEIEEVVEPRVSLHLRDKSIIKEE